MNSTEFDNVAAVQARTRHGRVAPGERLLAIIESVPDAIIATDENFCITLFNLAAEEMFGSSSIAAQGQSLRQFIPDATTSSDKQQHTTARRADGTRFSARIDISRTHLGTQSMFTAVVREEDCRQTKFAALIGTQQERATKGLSHQAEKLARSNLELDRFASVAAHDLTEPLRTVATFVDLLDKSAGESLNSEAAEYLRCITNAVNRMQLLLIDLLGYSRIGARAMPFVQVDCNEIVGNVVGNLNALIESKQAKIVIDPLPTVLADTTQLTQLFQNLLGNAMKFHKSGEPRIHVSVDQNEDEWIFSVQDNGIGIAPKHFERIFIIFQRLHTVEEYPGTGIGLAICKKIVDRHEGRIWVESTVGQGSTFRFTLAKRHEQAMQNGAQVIEHDRASRALEADVAHLSRVSTMGQMASGLAHELNQPLAAIMNYASVCIAQLGSEKGSHEKLQVALSELMNETRRAGSIISRMRTFVHKDQPRIEPIDLNKTINESLKMLSFQLQRQEIRPKVQLAGNLPPVLADRVQLEQVLVNLIRNAMEAMHEMNAAEKNLTVQSSLSGDGRFGEVCVIDSGAGVSRENLARLFEPFFTTKEKGMGMGLNISRSIVESFGGRLGAVLNPQKGMRFSFTLPIAEGPDHG